MAWLPRLLADISNPIPQFKSGPSSRFRCRKWPITDIDSQVGLNMARAVIAKSVYHYYNVLQNCSLLLLFPYRVIRLLEWICVTLSAVCARANNALQPERQFTLADFDPRIGRYTMPILTTAQPYNMSQWFIFSARYGARTETYEAGRTPRARR